MSEIESAGLRRLELDDPAAGILAYAVEGKVTTEEAKEVFERIKSAAAEGKKLRLYYEMHSFPKTEAGAILEKLKHVGTILRTLERVAIVGDQRWMAIYTTVFDPIMKAELRHFKTDEKDAAAAWMRD